MEKAAKAIDLESSGNEEQDRGIGGNEDQAPSMTPPRKKTRHAGLDEGEVDDDAVFGPVADADEKWQMGERLARLLLAVCAGSIDSARTALDNFRMNNKQFYPLGFEDVPGTGTCLVKDGQQLCHFVSTNTVCHLLLFACFLFL